MEIPLVDVLLRTLDRLLKRPALVCLAVGVLTILVRLTLLPILPIPQPAVHDEFSYLLASDTFASGRLANPTHPKWIFFETVHVNQQPTYVSKYLPAQGLALAFGQRFLGHPWYGVLLSTAAFMAALCWLLQGFVSPQWAFFGALVTIAQYGVGTYWMNSYYGGAVSGLGGALVIGSVPRLVRRASPFLMTIAAAGIAILLNSRPFEGGLTVLASFAALLYLLHKEGKSVWDVFRPWNLLPATVLLLAVVGWMGYYNYRTTGSPTTLAYMLNEKLYSYSSRFWFLPAKAKPKYNHASIAALWEWDYGLWEQQHANPLRIYRWWHNNMLPFLAPALWLFAVLAGIVLARGRTVRVALAMFAFVVGGVMLQIGQLPHYIAPVFGAWILLAVLGIREVSSHVRLRAFVVAGCFLVACAAGALVGMNRSSGIGGRENVIRELESHSGSHLVFVHYTPKHNFHEEWVYNAADIDKSRIVWAHDMGSRNFELLDYYPNRKVWLLNADELSLQRVR